MALSRGRRAAGVDVLEGCGVVRRELPRDVVAQDVEVRLRVEVAVAPRSLRAVDRRADGRHAERHQVLRVCPAPEEQCEHVLPLVAPGLPLR